MAPQWRYNHEFQSISIKMLHTENGHNWPCNFREEFEQCKIVHPQRTMDDGRRRTVIGHLSRLCDL